LALRGQHRVSIETLDHDWSKRAIDLWGLHQNVILSVAAVVIAAGVIGFFTLRARAQAGAQAAGKVAEASLDFWQGNYQRSLSTAQQVVSQFGGTPAGTDALRLVGDNQYWLGNFKDAITSYRKCLERERSGTLSDAVRRSLANALESDRQFDEAARLYAELAGRLDRESAADALMGAARCHRAAGRNSEAVAIYQRVASELGDTSQAPMARLYLAEITVPTLR
jgi:tetratricopeptide (TPR) repeat protein